MSYLNSGLHLTRHDTLPGVSKRAQASETHLKLARDVVIRGIPFTQAAVDAGYSKSCANLGPAQMRKQITGLDKAFTSVEQSIEWKPDVLKQAAINRIARTCADDKNSDNLRAAELIGKFKTVDLFVRNGEAQVGVFFGAMESKEDEINTLVLPEAADKPESR